MRIRRRVRFQEKNSGDHSVGTLVVPSDLCEKLRLRQGQELEVRAHQIGPAFRITYEGRVLPPEEAS